MRQGQTLLKILAHKDKKNRFISDLDRIKENAKDILNMIVVYFPQYTPHNIEHKERVLSNLDLFIPDSLANALNEFEIFFLIAAVYLHDVGMVGVTQIYEMSKPTKDSEIEKIRNEHHIRAEEYIIKNYQQLGIRYKQEAEIIGRICRGHRKESLRDQASYNPKHSFGIGYTINIALLASLLRIADELDLTFKRIPSIIYDHLPPTDEQSILEWEKHWVIHGKLIKIEPNFIMYPYRVY